MKYVVLVLALFGFPAVCAAEAVLVTPSEWDFGDVLIGETATTLFRVAGLDESMPLTVGDITIEEDLYSAFAITHVDPIPPELYLGDFFDFEVTFAPPSAGQFDGLVHIETNDIHNFPPDGEVLRPLTGRSVIPEPGSVVVWSVLGLVGISFAVWRRKWDRVTGVAAEPRGTRPG